MTDQASIPVPKNLMSWEGWEQTCTFLLHAVLATLWCLKLGEL